MDDVFRGRVFVHTSDDHEVTPMAIGYQGAHWWIFQRGTFVDGLAYRFEVQDVALGVTSRSEACERIMMWEYAGYEEIRPDPDAVLDTWDFTIVERTANGVVLAPFPAAKPVAQARELAASVAVVQATDAQLRAIGIVPICI